MDRLTAKQKHKKGKHEILHGNERKIERKCVWQKVSEVQNNVLKKVLHGEGVLKSKG